MRAGELTQSSTFWFLLRRSESIFFSSSSSCFRYALCTESTKSLPARKRSRCYRTECPRNGEAQQGRAALGFEPGGPGLFCLAKGFAVAPAQLRLVRVLLATFLAACITAASERGQAKRKVLAPVAVCRSRRPDAVRTSN